MFGLETIFCLEGVNDYFSKRTQVEKAVKAQVYVLATVEGGNLFHFLPSERIFWIIFGSFYDFFVF